MYKDMANWLSFIFVAIEIFSLLHTVCTLPSTGAAIFLFSGLFAIMFFRSCLYTYSLYTYTCSLSTPSLSFLLIYIQPIYIRLQSLYPFPLIPAYIHTSLYTYACSHSTPYLSFLLIYIQVYIHHLLSLYPFPFILQEMIPKIRATMVLKIKPPKLLQWTKSSNLSLIKNYELSYNYSSNTIHKFEQHHQLTSLMMACSITSPLHQHLMIVNSAMQYHCQSDAIVDYITSLYTYVHYNYLACFIHQNSALDIMYQ